MTLIVVGVGVTAVIAVMALLAVLRELGAVDARLALLDEHLRDGNEELRRIAGDINKIQIAVTHETNVRAGVYDRPRSLIPPGRSGLEP